MNDDWDNLPEPREPHCKCGYPDMPGQCPGWRNCPMCRTSAEDADADA